MNQNTLSKNLLVIALVVMAFFYAIPSLFGESPALQVSPKGGKAITEEILTLVDKTLADAKLSVVDRSQDAYSVTLSFPGSETQLKARDALKKALSDDVVVALTLVPNMPAWMNVLGAAPMRLGLDLRGGMYFLLDIDTQAVVENTVANFMSDIRKAFREENIRYTAVKKEGEQGFAVSFKNDEAATAGKAEVKKRYPTLQVSTDAQDPLTIRFALTEQEIIESKRYAANQTVQVMRNRVNELGVAEASVSKQGNDRVVIELPGVQDAAQAKEVLGGTATLKVMLVDESADTAAAVAGKVPAGSRVYYREGGYPVVLKNRVVLTGNAVTGASSGYDEQTNTPNVNIRLSGPEVSKFSRVTGQNVGHPMAIVLVQTFFNKQEINGEIQRVTRTKETVISVATINQRLGARFQIMGIGSANEAKNLALMIRAGALPAPVSIVEEREIGPSLGEKNIEMGTQSVIVAMAAVMVFMALYYGVFGILADIALVLNLFFIVAVMSLLPGATLTLPGIAGIVLNVGMAIDANVLIFERIREELRKGTGVQSAIHAGYERAFATIVDSNVTTLIVALILFVIGSGPVKGFAVTLMIGIISSMFTAITVTRTLSNAIYGGRKLKRISIGI